MSVPQQPWPNSGGQRAPGPPPGGPGGPSGPGGPNGPPPGYQRPAPPPQQPQQAPPPRRDGTAMTALRVISYVLTSIASLLFIIMVIYTLVKIDQLQDSLATSPFGGLGGGTSSLEGTFGG